MESQKGRSDTLRWGPIFWEGKLRIASLVNTKCWGQIKPNSEIADLFALGGVGDLEAIKEKYVNMPFKEFEKAIQKEE